VPVPGSKGGGRAQIGELGITLSARVPHGEAARVFLGATATAEQDMHAPQRLGWRRLQETVAVLSRVNMQQHAAR